MQQWMINEISTGFQKLFALSLDRQPSADIIDVTVMAWCEAISHGKVWGSDDATRFREAFTTVAATFNQWPTPRQFLEAMPPRPRVVEKPVLRIVSDENVEQSKKFQAEQKVRVDAIIAEISSKLKIS